MTKKDLLKALEKHDDYACIIIDLGDGSWSCIEEVKRDGCHIILKLSDHPENLNILDCHKGRVDDYPLEVFDPNG